MKKIAALTIALAPALSLAQSFGTKKDAMALSTGSGSVGFGMVQLLQIVVSLGIVYVILKYVLPKFAGKLGRKLNTGLNSSIRIEESANFAGGTLYIVNVKNKSLLLSVASTGVTCLADLSETTPQQLDPKAFFEMLDERQASSAPFPFAVAAEENVDEIEAEETTEDTLVRLRRLAE